MQIVKNIFQLKLLIVCVLFFGTPQCLFSQNSKKPTIKWKSFKALVEGDKIKLSWVTSAEENNQYFMLQKGLNGIDFENFEKIAGSGTTSKDITYKSYDYEPFKGGVSYYRILQHSHTGEESFSEIVSTNVFRKTKELEVVTYTEKEEITIFVWNDETDGRLIEIFDNLGNVVYSQRLIRGVENVKVNLSGFKNGMYFVNSQGKKGNKYAKFIVNK